MNIKEIIENKNVLFFGDSITHNWIKWGHNLEPYNIDTKDYSGYIGYIKNSSNPKSITNVGISGGCYSSCTYLAKAREEFRHFNYQVDHAIEYIKNADVIFIFFGTNDYSEQVPFGINTSMDSKTFHGGINSGIEKIKKINGNATIFIIGMLYRTCPIDAKTFAYSQNEYNLAIKERAKAHNIHLIDVSNLFDDNNIKENTLDGLHPNEAGSKILAERILGENIL